MEGLVLGLHYGTPGLSLPPLPLSSPSSSTGQPRERHQEGGTTSTTTPSSTSSNPPSPSSRRRKPTEKYRNPRRRARWTWRRPGGASSFSLDVVGAEIFGLHYGTLSPPPHLPPPHPTTRPTKGDQKMPRGQTRRYRGSSSGRLKVGPEVDTRTAPGQPQDRLTVDYESTP